MPNKEHFTNNPMISFNTPYTGRSERGYVDSFTSRSTESFAKECIALIKGTCTDRHVFLTHSCTGALELALLYLGIGPGDEVILPSFTYVSTANAVAIRGGTPVFVDIRYDTKVINCALIEEAITPRTKAIILVHYSGVTCDIGLVKSIARKHGVFLIEDAAQSYGAFYKGCPQGHIGDIGCISFHKTKNIHCFTGGAISVDSKTVDIELLEKMFYCGTDRLLFLKGAVSKYSWQCVGSNFEINPMATAFLYGQLQNAQLILDERLRIWSLYHKEFKRQDQNLPIDLPVIPSDCKHNAHIYSLVFGREEQATSFIAQMNESGIECTRHYTPLHSSMPGLIFGRNHRELTITERISDGLVRLPLWVGLDRFQSQIIETSVRVIKHIS
jgi:dTDP-4-amino-4,6-dideoxygalactose transaminase